MYSGTFGLTRREFLRKSAATGAFVYLSILDALKTYAELAWSEGKMQKCSGEPDNKYKFKGDLETLLGIKLTEADATLEFRVSSNDYCCSIVILDNYNKIFYSHSSSGIVVNNRLVPQKSEHYTRANFFFTNTDSFVYLQFHYDDKGRLKSVDYSENNRRTGKITNKSREINDNKYSSSADIITTLIQTLLDSKNGNIPSVVYVINDSGKPEISYLELKDDAVKISFGPRKEGQRVFFKSVRMGVDKRLEPVSMEVAIEYRIKGVVPVPLKVTARRIN